jgi:hypothetical protein
VQRRKVGTEEQSDRLSDGREDLARGRLLRDKYCQSAQRRLLLGEPLHFRARLGVRERRRDQIREPLQALLGVRWLQRVSRRDDHRAPEPALSFDRGAAS